MHYDILGLSYFSIVSLFNVFPKTLLNLSKEKKNCSISQRPLVNEGSKAEVISPP